MNIPKGQLTLRGAVVGLAGCAVITAASVYTALKMGALPWPIIFVAIISLFFLKALGRKRATSLNEANVTHTIMSAGAMVAGGLAFTVPGIWILGAGDASWGEMLAVALAGVVMGLVCTAVLRRHFIERENLEFPIGQAAAQTLIAGNGGTDDEVRAKRAGAADASGRGTGGKLFGAMGAAGVFCALRDAAGVVPAMVATLPVPGVAFGIYCSPMLIAVGYLVGVGAVAAWIAGAVFANFGLIWGASSLGAWDVAFGQGVVSSLGMGLMMGAGFGVVVKLIASRVRSSSSRNAGDSGRVERGGDERRRFRVTAGLAACAVAACALIVCFVLGLGPVPALIVVALTWITTAMSAQSVGQTGIDPMEIFGLIVLLVIAAMGESNQVKLFFTAAVIAIACGLAGDVMSDFKTGAIIGTNPRDLWRGQAIGALLGCVVSVAVMAALLGAYGADAFGPGKLFVSAQASVVATMVSGIPSVPGFITGLVAGIALYCLGIPSMMLGLGIYLPFYMSLTAAVGALIKAAYDRVCARRSPAEGAETTDEESGIIVASGILGGESIVGVLIALAAVAGGMLG